MNYDLLTLKEFPLFYQMPEDDVKQFITAGFRFTYEAKTPLVVNNDRGETFFLILKGLVKIVLNNAYGEEVHVTLLKTGDFFGEMAILDKLPIRNANVIAVSEVEVLTVERKNFLNYAVEHPQLLINLARVLGYRLKDTNERMSAMALPEENKIARTLLQMAVHGKAFSEEGPILLPNLTLKDWVLFCNTSQDRFMQTIEVIRSSGAIEWQNQRIVVKDLSTLARCSKERALATAGGTPEAGHSDVSPPIAPSGIESFDPDSIDPSDLAPP